MAMTYEEAIQPHVSRAKRDGRVITHVRYRDGHADVTFDKRPPREPGDRLL